MRSLTLAVNPGSTAVILDPFRRVSDAMARGEVYSLIESANMIAERRFVIRVNRKVEIAHCALCGNSPEPDVGPQLFTADSCEYACWDCGKDGALELVVLLELAKASQDYISVLLEASDYPHPEDVE